MSYGSDFTNLNERISQWAYISFQENEHFNVILKEFMKYRKKIHFQKNMTQWKCQLGQKQYHLIKSIMKTCYGVLIIMLG